MAARLVDVCKIPLAKGMILDYQAETKLGTARYLLKIIDVRGDIAGEREVDVKKLSATTDDDVPFISTLKLNPSQELKAVVTNTEPDSDTAPQTPQEWNKLVVSELAKWLQQFPQDNFRKPFPVCMEYLIRLGLIPKFDKENHYQKIKHQALLRKICQSSNGVLYTKSGWITYTNSVQEAEAQLKKVTNKTVSNMPTRTIYAYHILKCIEHLCASNLFYDSDSVQIDYGRNPNYKE